MALRPPDAAGYTGHYRDNRVRYFFSHPGEFAAAGGIGAVFGAGAVRQTDATTDGGQFKTAVTDSGREVRRSDDKPGISNLIDIMSVATDSSPEAIEAEYGDGGYGVFKQAVGEAVVTLLEPIRERYTELRADEPELLRLLRVGADKAREASAPTLAEIVRRMGFVQL